MSVVMLGLGVMPVGSPRWLSPLSRSLQPRERVRLSVSGLVAGVVLVEFALVLLAVPTVVRATGVDSLAAACRRLLGDLAPGGLQVGWSAAALAVLLPVLAYRGWRRAIIDVRDAWIEPTLGVHREADGVEVVLLPSDVLVAYSAEADGPQIVVSDGLTQLLSPAELDMVLRHELAHLRGRDGRVLRLLAACEAAIPLLRFVTHRIKVAIERAADEAAAGSDRGGRSTLLRALLRVAAPEFPAAIAGFTSRSGVVERVSGLLGPPPAPTVRQRATARLALLGSGGTALVVLGAWGYEAHMMLSMAGVCRM